MPRFCSSNLAWRANSHWAWIAFGKRRIECAGFVEWVAEDDDGGHRMSASHRERFMLLVLCVL